MLLLIFAIGARVVYIQHPILFKFPGSAKIIGKPISATVYTNGHIDTSIKVYQPKVWGGGTKSNGNAFLLNLKEFDADGMLKYVYVDLDSKWIGRPVSTNIADCDFVNGNLIQGDVGAHFVDFRDDMKGYDFDPKLNFSAREIKFNMPPKILKYDSVRIELEKLQSAFKWL